VVVVGTWAQIPVRVHAQSRRAAFGAQCRRIDIGVERQQMTMND
jgi:hypothetical protein